MTRIDRWLGRAQCLRAPMAGAFPVAIAALVLFLCLSPLTPVLAAALIGAQGAAPGRFSVDATGQAVYTIPIQTPAAAGGTRPHLALVYQSGARDTLAGPGWALAGLSSITRCPALGSAGGTGAYCLDGQRLVLTSGTFGASGSAYRKEIDDYTTITAFQYPGSGRLYFFVRHRDGTVGYYGDTDDSSPLNPVTGSAEAWMINDRQDPSGNAIDFSYEKNDTTGEFRISKIEYAHNSAQSLAPQDTVYFDYEDRPADDQRTGYFEGAQWTHNKRLHAIRIENATAGSIYTYVLNYGQEPVTRRSLLTSVTQCHIYNCLPVYQFQWQNAQSGWLGGQGGTASEGDDAYALKGDFNGDGQEDLYVPQGGTWHVIEASGGLLSVNINTGASDPYYNYAATIDFNGDGRTDLLYRSTDGTWHVYESNGTSGFTDIGTGVSTANAATSIGVDLDGDGIDDWVYTDPVGYPYSGYIKWRHNSGGAFGAEQTLYTWGGGDVALMPGGGRLPDVNGDGHQDLVVRTVAVTGPSGQYLVSYGTFVLTASGYQAYAVVAQSTTNIDAHPQAIDLNGDGLDDIIYCLNGLWYTRLSTGTGYTAPVAAAIPFNAATASMLHVTDYDLDGREDVLAVTSGGMYVYRSNGTTLVGPGIEVLGDATQDNVHMLDVNGDGYDDIELSIWGVFGVSLHASGFADSISKFTDEFGNSYSPHYAPLSTSTAYHSSAPAVSAPVVREARDARRIVTAYDVADANGAYTIQYAYWNALKHVQGRGFLGFSHIAVTDPREGTRIVERDFRQDFPYIGRLDLEQEEQGDGKPIRIVDPQWTSAVLGSGAAATRFVHPDSVSTQTRQIGGSYNGWNYLNTREDFTYETYYGRLTRTVTTASTPFVAGAYTTTTSLVYWPNSDCLDLVELRTVTRSATNVPNPATATRMSQNSYDAECRLQESTDLSQSDPAQLRTSYTYDGYGNVKTVTQGSADGSAAPRETTYFYDPDGAHVTSEVRLAPGTDPTTSYTWDERLGKPLTMTGPGGLITHFAYDDFGRLTGETRPDGTSSTWDYTACTGCAPAVAGWPDPSAWRVKRTDSDGFYTESYLDSLGQVVGQDSVLAGGGVAHQRSRYDSRGRLVAKTRPFKTGETPAEITLTYDLIDRLTERSAPLDTGTADTHYSYTFGTTRVMDALGHTTTQNANVLGETTSVIDAMGGTTTYAYAPFGQLTEVVDAAGNVTQVGYDALGEKISSTDPDMGEWHYAYTVFGELASQTDAKSQTVSFAYDQLGRPTYRTEPEGTTHWQYYTAAGPNLGLPESVLGPDGYSEVYTYDARRPSAVTKIIDGTSYQTEYGYAAGKLASITYPESLGPRLEVDYHYDASGYLHTVSNAATPSEVYYTLDSVDAAGRETEATLGNGLIEQRHYSPATGRIESLETGPSATPTAVQQLTYAWDELGNLHSREDVNQPQTEIFTYDALNRLDAVQLNGQPTLSLAYDAIGNITNKSDVGTYTYGAGTAGPHAVTSISGPRAASYAYDANGNMVSRGGDAISWTSFNKPAVIHDGSTWKAFAYAPDRHRYKEVTYYSTWALSTYNISPLFVQIAGGPYVQYRQLIFAGGRAIAIDARTTSATTLHYLHYDSLGSAVAVTDAAGAPEERYSYDAFGKRRNPDWSADPTDSEYAVTHFTRDQGFTGHENLDILKLINMKGRVQDPITGRFLSADPFVQAPYASQSLNRYSYTWNNPLSLVDPTGYRVCIIFICFGSHAQPPDCDLECQQQETKKWEEALKWERLSFHSTTDAGAAWQPGQQSPSYGSGGGGGSSIRPTTSGGAAGTTVQGKFSGPVPPVAQGTRAQVDNSWRIPMPEWTSDSDVKRQFFAAWIASRPYAMPPSRRQEQGGWVVHYWWKDGSNYDVIRVSPGTNDQLPGLAREPSFCFCTVVGNFHTHPGRGKDGYAPYSPSDNDLDNSRDFGIPGVIVTYPKSEDRFYQLIPYRGF